MYQETLALGDNPFDPKNFEGKPGCSESLGRLPLRVDLCEKVVELYCEELEKFRQLEAEFKEQLRQEGYSAGKKRSNSSFVIIVRGPQGSGKTTLASKFLKILHETGQPGDPDWVSKATEFRDISLDDQQLSGVEIEQTLEKLKQRITSSSDKLHVSALIDNVTETAIGEVLKLFRQLSDRRRVFILTAHDLKLLDKNLACLSG
jgi:predicted AAA+ superfamily ATPase